MLSRQASSTAAALRVMSTAESAARGAAFNSNNLLESGEPYSIQ
jgi:hypothetical protein